jgi:AbrB family looped-hinge helix DNA binding protein
MGYFSTMTSKGQLTVPQELRKRQGLKKGDRVEFVAEKDRTVIRPARTESNSFDKFIGIFGPFPGGEEGIKAWIDDMRSDKDYE